MPELEVNVERINNTLLPRIPDSPTEARIVTTTGVKITVFL